MRRALPGTHHSTMVHHCEPMILSAVKRCPGVKKVKAGRIAWTGSGPRRLQLVYARCHRTVEGWLFIGTAKRLVLIYPGSDVALGTLGGRLAAILARYKVCVEIKERVI
jgi:hypothetical protein